MRTCHKLLRFTNCTHFHGTKWDSFFCECSNVNQNIKSTKIHKFWIKNFHQLFKSDLIKNAEWKVILISQLKIGCFCCWFFFFQNVKNADEASLFFIRFLHQFVWLLFSQRLQFYSLHIWKLPKMRQKKIQWKKFMIQKKFCVIATNDDHQLELKSNWWNNVENCAYCDLLRAVHIYSKKVFFFP